MKDLKKHIIFLISVVCIAFAFLSAQSQEILITSESLKAVTTNDR